MTLRKGLYLYPALTKGYREENTCFDSNAKQTGIIQDHKRIETLKIKN